MTGRFSKFITTPDFLEQPTARPALQELLADLKKEKLMWFWSIKLIGSLVRRKIFTN